jgi:hypothetical protein
VPTDPYLVPFPRIPTAGEVVYGPDGAGPWVVVLVAYHFDDGFYFTPARVEVVVEEHS